MGKKTSMLGKIWAVVLLFTGVVMFFSIPGRVAEIQSVKQYSEGAVLFMRFCFYMISILLAGGGLKKLMAARHAENESE